MLMTLVSSAFSHGGCIPSRYTCDGENISPPLSIFGAPDETVSFALITYDPVIPKELYPPGSTFDHWTVFNISPDIAEIHEGENIGTQGKNGVGKNGYTGPCPPPQYAPKEHRYFFTLYALNATLSLKEGATKDEVFSEMQGHILAKAELMGRYAREKSVSL